MLAVVAFAAVLHVPLATVVQVEHSSNHLQQAMADSSPQAETAKKKRLHKTFLNAEAV